MILWSIQSIDAWKVLQASGILCCDARFSDKDFSAATVTIRGDGKGGRNQEFALAGAMEIAGMTEVVLFSAGTDGTDGPTDAAGGMGDGGTVARALRRGLEPRKYLERNDSYSFLETVGDLVMTGPTGTNVMDVRLVLVGDECA